MEDKVIIVNCPPVSARKRFALHKILKSPDAERDAKHAREAQAAAAGAAGSNALGETTTTAS